MTNRSYRSGFSLVELLVVIAIVGTLIGLLLPAVQKARESGNRARCANNLKQMGLALHGYHQDHGILPPGLTDHLNSWENSIITNHTGFVRLLPYIGEEALYQKYDFNYPSCNATWGYLLGYPEPPTPNFAGRGIENSPANAEVVGTLVSVFACPSDQEPVVDTIGHFVVHFDWYGFEFDMMSREMTCTNARRSNYLLCMAHDIMLGSLDSGKSAFGYGSSLKFKEVRDGLSSTIAIGETRQEHSQDHITIMFWNAYCLPHWGAGHLHAVDGWVDQPLNGWAGKVTEIEEWGPLSTDDPNYRKPWFRTFGSWHAAGGNFLFLDGSVKFLRDSISMPTYQALGTANGRDAIGAFE